MPDDREPEFGERSESSGLRLRFSSLLVFAAVVLPAVVALRSSMATIDLAYQIRAGETMLDSGRVLETELFTFTARGRPWLNQQWGSQIVLASIFRAGSWELIAIMRAAVVGASFWLLYLACRARGAGIRQSAWLCLGALLVSIYAFHPRPQLLAFLLFALTLAIVAARDRHASYLWLIPPITLIWANVHGSFPLATVLLVLAWIEDRRNGRPWERTTILAAIASVAAATINPYGLEVWRYVVALSTNPEVRETIDEWQPPSVTTADGLLFFASAVAVAAIAARNHRRLGWPRLIGLLIFFVLGVTAIRGVIWWALAAPVLIADLFPATPERRDEPRSLNTVLAASIVLVGLVFLPWFRPTFTSSANSASAADGLLSYAPNEYSARVVASAEPGTRLFVSQLWASWFEIAAPEYPVMVDPRIELFSSEIWDDYDDISRASTNWEVIVDRWGIDVLVLSRRQQSALIAVVDGAPGWKAAFEDADGALLVREE